MTARNSVLLILFCLLAFVVACLAQTKPSDAEKAANKAGSDDAWSWGNAFVIKNYVDQLYYPHARALLDAEQKLKSGSKRGEIVKTLSALPGIRGVVLSLTSGGQSVQWPDSLVWLDALNSILFNSSTAKQGKTVSPMTHRTVGGKVKYQQVPMGDKFLDLMVRYVHSDTIANLPTAAISLVMDQKWLTAQIPAAMDSLYRENSQLLFCAESPTNHLWEQSLGVIAGKDTLWWVGRKDVKIRNVQELWPFASIKVPSYVHSLEKK